MEIISCALDAVKYYTAITKGDAESAKRYMHEHLEHSRGRYRLQEHCNTGNFNKRL